MNSKNITVEDILRITNGKLVFAPTNTENIFLENVSKDTRTIKNGDTYFGIKGEKFNGSDFWEQAVNQGARIAILQDIDFTHINKEKFKDTTIIVVDDTVNALGEIAKYKRSLYDIPVIAITGSVGKTSTKDIVANVVSQKYNTLKTQGNLNNQIGLPLTILELRDHEALVVEMGMNKQGEIRYLTKIAKPTLTVVTNVGTSHIGNLGSRENILKAKLEIIEGMDNKKIIINNDNDLLHKYYEENKGNNEIKFITFGIENQSDIMAKQIKLEENGSTFALNTTSKFKVPVGGIHFVYNALCSIAVARQLGIEDEKIKKGIENFELTKKRMEIIELKNGAKLINDAYNASFESMQASFKYLASFNNKRKIAVLGDMLELGEFSKKIHQNVGKEVAKNGIDLLVCIGKESQNIAEGATQVGMSEEKIKNFETNQEAQNYLKNLITANDIVLFKASNGMKLFDIVSNLQKTQ